MRTFVAFILSAALSLAQAPVRQPEQMALLDRVINGDSSEGKLNCEVQVFKPFLDFSFRFEAGYLVRCPLAQFDGRDTGVAAYLRIRPEGGTAVYLGDGFRMPAMPKAMRSNYAWQHLHNEAEFSGVFVAGPGRYFVDLVVVDDQSRVFHKNWLVKVTTGRSERKAEIAIRENTAMSASMPPWHNTREKERGDLASDNSGPQITVLLDIAPVFPASHKLRAWDRAFLLGSLTSLLRGVKASSVRLIAFNLEQQKEVFHEETFSRENFPQLVQALRSLELGTISYKTLQTQEGWADLLVGLVNHEGLLVRPPDAVVFLGPNVRNVEKIPREALGSCASLNNRLFYLEFFAIPGYEFPDTIHQLTSTCRGNIYKLHSPADLAEAISKLQVRLASQLALEAAPAPR